MRIFIHSTTPYRSVERRRNDLGDNLFRLDFIRDVSLLITPAAVNIGYTLSLTPRLRKRAPAKYRDRRAITQT